MNKYNVISVFVLIFSVIVGLFLSKLWSEEEDTKIKKSKSRLQRKNNRSAKDSLRTQFTKAINENANASKKYEIETMCIQAGIRVNYGEFFIIRLTSTILIPIVFYLLTNNFFLIILFALIGYNLPTQFFKTISNKRKMKMEKQCGSFMRIVLERYKITKDISYAMKQSLPDFKGNEPFYTLLKESIADLDMGKTVEDSLYGLARATGNKYLGRFADYYSMTERLGSQEDKLSLLHQAYKQFEDDEKMKLKLKDKINGPTREAYIMVGCVPIFFLYQSFFTEGYLEFMLKDATGQLGLAISMGLLLGCVWFINFKIGGPIE